MVKIGVIWYPDFETDTEGWWTCDKKTKQGDLVFLYRAQKKRDIGYLIQAVSDAYDIRDDEFARRMGGNMVATTGY